jgi:hypothetical protein
MVAIKFCDDNSLPQNMLGDVVVFVQNAMGGAQAAPAAPPAAQLTDAQKADMVAQVVAMGFDAPNALAALEQTGFAGVDAALNKLLA